MGADLLMLFVDKKRNIVCSNNSVNSKFSNLSFTFTTLVVALINQQKVSSEQPEPGRNCESWNDEMGNTLLSEKSRSDAISTFYQKILIFS